MGAVAKQRRFHIFFGFGHRTIPVQDARPQKGLLLESPDHLFM
jgi:hypothetical protein